MFVFYKLSITDTEISCFKSIKEKYIIIIIITRINNLMIFKYF